MVVKKRGKRWNQCTLTEAIAKMDTVSRQAVSKALQFAKDNGDTATVEIIEQARAAVMRENYLNRKGRETVLAQEAKIIASRAAKVVAENEFMASVSKPVVGMEGKWSVTPDARIYSHTGSRWLKPTVQGTGNGYYGVKSTGGSMYVHRIVAEAFIPNPEGKRTVNHKDGNTRNNHVDNLEWATHKENTAHAIETGLWHPNRRLEAKDVAAIKEILRKDSGSVAQRQMMAAELFGTSYSNIQKIAAGYTWKHVT